MTQLDASMFLVILNMSNTVLLFASGAAARNWRVAVLAIAVCAASIGIGLAALVAA